MVFKGVEDKVAVYSRVFFKFGKLGGHFAVFLFLDLQGSFDFLLTLFGGLNCIVLRLQFLGDDDVIFPMKLC